MILSLPGSYREGQLCLVHVEESTHSQEQLASKLHPLSEGIFSGAEMTSFIGFTTTVSASWFTGV